MQVGPQFLDLCQEQVNLMVHGLGSSFAIIALLERPTKRPECGDLTFFPVIAYPEGFSALEPEALMTWLAEVWMTDIDAPQNAVYSSPPPSQPPCESVMPETLGKNPDTNNNSGLSVWPSRDLARDLEVAVTLRKADLCHYFPLNIHQNRLVLSLIYQEVMMGMLVTGRMDRPWHEREQYAIKCTARTLAAACVLDQRSQWLEQRLQQQAITYAQLHDHQQDIVDDVLHQFRNPLTAVRTFGKLLLKRLQPEDRNRSVAESIVRESDRLQELLSQLSASLAVPAPALPSASDPVAGQLLQQDEKTSDLDAIVTEVSGVSASSGMWQELPSSQLPPSAIDPNEQHDIIQALTGKPIHLEVHNILAILEPLMVSAQAIAQEREIALSFTAPDKLPPVQVDARALQEVLNNLLDNALKYTPQGGQIEVVLAIDGGIQVDGYHRQGVAIADTGPGIPLSDQPHLFERHFRGVQAEGDIPGTGLGLAIAQLLTRQMKGDIEVYSPLSRCPYPVSIRPRSPQHKTSVDDLGQTDTEPFASDSGKSLSPSINDNSGTVFIVWMLSASTSC